MFPTRLAAKSDFCVLALRMSDLSARCQGRHGNSGMNVGRAPGTYQESTGIGIASAQAAAMRQKALAEQITEDMNASGPYALAIEPDDSQARILEQMLNGRIGGTLRVVRSTEEAFASLVQSIPDLILMSPLLPPQDEEQILGRLAALGAGASHVQLLSIPRVVGDQPAEKKRRFGWQAQKGASTANGGRDASAFANEVAEYLAQACTLRQVESRR